MARFNLMVLLVAAGAGVGSAFRPGVPEIAIVAALVCGTAVVYRRLAVGRVTKVS